MKAKCLWKFRLGEAPYTDLLRGVPCGPKDFLLSCQYPHRRTSRIVKGEWGRGSGEKGVSNEPRLSSAKKFQ